MSWIGYASSSSTSTASGGWYTPRARSSLKDEINELKDEMDKIAKEEEEDKQKYLPRFDPKNLDI